MATRRGAANRAAQSTATDLPARLHNLAANLWWTWSADAQRLFAALDPLVWQASEHTPLRCLAQVAPHRWDALARDADFIALLERCETESGRYLASRTWFDRTIRGGDRGLLVAYFCSEYAIHESMQQYAGGLGVLAGDHLKSASDLGIPLVAVGLLYRHGYYRQSLASDGSTRVAFPTYDFRDWPIDDSGPVIACPVGRRLIHAKVRRMRVGRTQLVLLDADIPANRPADRNLTDRLYQGAPEHRLLQQILLGVGGFRALEALGLHPTVFHLNEGHAAFVGLERLRVLQQAGYSYDDAFGLVYRSSVFTTHTPVAAGHDRYEPGLLMRHFAPLAEALGLSRSQFLALGRERPADAREPFCMTVLALKLSAHCNGVAKLHGETTRQMWAGLYHGTAAHNVPIGHVTNGIHVQTWLAPEMSALYDRYLKPRWIGAGPENNWWSAVGRIPPAELWRTRNRLRRRLITFIRQRLLAQALRRSAGADELLAAQTVLDDDALTIGFARRFATYKRAPLIFHDRRRLARILNDSRQPVQLVFAGKAHPADAGGQAFARQIAQFSRLPEFRGKVVLLEDYDMEVGRMLTSGCDVWLNNPIRPMEASGTSGMKPPLHGGINCSILDGWWPEAYNGRNGFAIGDARSQATSAAQDRYDVAALYAVLERRLIPLFYRRDARGLPAGWVRMMVESMRTVCARFNTHRMLAEYLQDYYLPAHRSS